MINDKKKIATKSKKTVSARMITVTGEDKNIDFTVASISVRIIDQAVHLWLAIDEIA